MRTLNALLTLARPALALTFITALVLAMLAWCVAAALTMPLWLILPLGAGLGIWAGHLLFAAVKWAWLRD